MFFRNFCYVLFFATTVSCTLLGSRKGQDPRVVASTSFKFFGERSVSLNVTGRPVIEIDWEGEAAFELCEGYYDKNLHEHSYAGHVVVFTNPSISGRCVNHFTSLYTKLLELNALAVLVSVSDAIPGRYLFLHDISRGLYTRYHRMPFLEVSVKDVPDFVGALRAGNVVILESTPNSWQAIYESPHMIFFLRVLPSLMSLFTAIAAVHRFRQLDGNHRVYWVLTKALQGDLTISEAVLMIEASSMAALAVILGIGKITSDALTGISVAFFLSSFTGVGLFTTVLLLMQLRDIRNRVNVIDNAGMTKPLRDYGWQRVGCIAVVTMATEFISLLVSLVFFNSSLRLYFDTICMVVILFHIIAQVGVALSFTCTYFSVVWPRRNGSNVHEQKSVSLFVTWLAISGFCMFLHSVSIVFAIINLHSEPSHATYAYGLVSITRISVSLAQVFSIRAALSHDIHSASAVVPRDKQIVELDNIHSICLVSSPRPCEPGNPMIKCGELGEARHSRIRKSFTDSEVAAINFDANGHRIQVNQAKGTRTGRVVDFLFTTVPGRNMNWLRVLRQLPRNTQFSLTRTQLGCWDETYFDVKVRVPCEGEVLICIQESPILSTPQDVITMMQEEDPAVMSSGDKNDSPNGDEGNASASSFHSSSPLECQVPREKRAAEDKPPTSHTFHDHTFHDIEVCEEQGQRTQPDQEKLRAHVSHRISTAVAFQKPSKFVTSHAGEGGEQQGQRTQPNQEKKGHGNRHRQSFRITEYLVEENSVSVEGAASDEHRKDDHGMCPITQAASVESESTSPSRDEKLRKQTLRSLPSLQSGFQSESSRRRPSLGQRLSSWDDFITTISHCRRDSSSSGASSSNNTRPVQVPKLRMHKLGTW